MAQIPQRIIILAAALAACGRPSDAGSTFTAQDSAGIEIVTSFEPAWTDADAWRLSDGPVLEIGRVEGDEAYLLYNVVDVTRLDDGGVVVANGGDETIRRYDARGRFLWKAGREGEGPGEFAQIWHIGSVDDGILVTQSREFWPSAVFDLDGRYVRTIHKTAALRFLAPPDFLLEDGSLILTAFRQQARGEVWIDSVTYLRLSADGSTLDTIVRAPATQYGEAKTREPLRVALSPNLAHAAGRDRLFTTFPDDYSIEVYDLTGRLVREIRRAWTPVPVTEEDIVRHRREYLDVSPALRVRREQNLAESRYAEHHPAHGPMIADRAGSLWVSRLVPSGLNPQPDDVPIPWDVFDPAGVWLGTLRTPARFNVLEVGDDYIAGIWRNDLDVQFVRVYRLEKPE